MTDPLDQDKIDTVRTTRDAVRQEADGKDVEARVRQILDRIRPYVQMDGGDVEFAGLKDNVVYVHMRGACHGCPSALITLKMGIERQICEQVPEIVAVEAL
ncbi:MAG: hypothetical protein Kow0059_16410 [Candidatus Sumerlaeia bacterium]